MKKTVGMFLVAATCLALAGCLGRSSAALKLNSSQITRMSDSKVCDALIELGATNQLSGTWLIEAQKRQLTYCVEQGKQKAQRRREAMDRISKGLQTIGNEISKSQTYEVIPGIQPPGVLDPNRNRMNCQVYRQTYGASVNCW